MDWSEILTYSEAEYMRSVLSELRSIAWAKPLVQRIEQNGGICYVNKPFLFEARIAHALSKCDLSAIEYEFNTGVGNTSVDFFIQGTARWFLEVVSIGRSNAIKAATVTDGPFYRYELSSPREDQTPAQRKQSEEGESILVMQKIGAKVQNKSGPVKFPAPQQGTYSAVIVDMRGHFGGGDIYDWKQIAFGASSVPPEYRKYWITEENSTIPMHGIWDLNNTMSFAKFSRERLHAIMFISEENYDDESLARNTWTACNPHLFQNEEEARSALMTMPLWRMTIKSQE